MTESEMNENRRHLRPLDVVLAITLALVAATPPTIMALAAFFKAEQTHNLVNSRMTEMIAIYSKAAADAATLAERIRQEQIRLQQNVPALPPIPALPAVPVTPEIAPPPNPTLKEIK